MYKTLMDADKSNLHQSFSLIFDENLNVGLPWITRAGWLDSQPGRLISREKCPGDDIILCLSGSAKIFTNDNIYIVNPGDLVWISGNRPHYHKASINNPWSKMWFRISHTKLANLKSHLIGENTDVIKIKNISLFKDWFIELFQILSLSNDENNMKINFMLAKLFVLFSNNNDDKNKKMNVLSDLIGKIKINPNFQWTSEDMQKEAGLSNSQIRKLFKSIMNCTPREYVNNCRIQKAKDLIINSNYLLKEIAFNCGYYDQFHFSREFKKITRLSPSEWKKYYL